MTTYHNSGFTTVEVLITLFVGAMLLGGGYQLYSIVTQASAQARNQADASNIVYEQLRKHQGQVSGTCSAANLTITNDIPNDTTLPGSATMALSRSCPFGNGDPVSLLSITLTYGEQGAESDVTHSLYAY